MSRRNTYVPKEYRNPLRKFPKTHSCICGSGDQFQICCLKYQPRAISKEWCERIIQVWPRLLNGNLRIVPPKKAQQLDEEMLNPPAPMPAVPMEDSSDAANKSAVSDVPVVSNWEESMLAGAAEGYTQSSDGGSESADVGADEGQRSD